MTSQQVTKHTKLYAKYLEDVDDKDIKMTAFSGDNSLLDGEKVIINGDGHQTRDLLYVKDGVYGVIKAMESSSDSSEIFLLSTNTETSVNKVLNTIEEIVGVKANIVHSDFLKGDIMRMRYDYSKAKNSIGFEPKYSLEQGITRLVEYMQKIQNKVK